MITNMFRVRVNMPLGTNENDVGRKHEREVGNHEYFGWWPAEARYYFNVSFGMEFSRNNRQQKF